MRQSFTLVFAGIVLGILGTISGTRLLGSLLYGIGAYDVPVYLAVVFLLALTALLATSIPARRASRVNPMVALRTE